jgi:thioredoxin reductase (NADPH)
VQGRRVGVIGPEDVALREAIFLRDFTPYVSILCNFPADFSPLGRARAKQQEIKICDAVVKVLPRPEGFEITMANGDAVRTVDVIYPSMGCEVTNELAVAVGAECDDEGYIRIGSHLETTITGLYAIERCSQRSESDRSRIRPCCALYDAHP